MIQEKDYGYAVDWWTLGVTMYEMLCGQPPFEADDELELFDNIVNDSVSYPRWISSSARTLLVQLLKKDPLQRYVSLNLFPMCMHVHAHKDYDIIL